MRALRQRRDLRGWGPTVSRPAMTTIKTLKLPCQTLPDLARSRDSGNLQKDSVSSCDVRLTVCGTRLSLTVVAVVVTRDQGLVDVDRVGDGLAETVTFENHGDKLFRLARNAGEKWAGLAGREFGI